MRGQADLFLDYDAPLGPVETKLIDRIIIKARHQRETLKAPDHESTARMLEATGDYRVLRRLQPRPVAVSRSPRQGEKIAVIVDTETTGLDQTRDEVIELGMIALTYDGDGQVGDVIGTFNALREPGVPISPEITRLTGITPDMFRCRSFSSRSLGRSHRKWPTEPHFGRSRATRSKPKTTPTSTAAWQASSMSQR